MRLLGVVGFTGLLFGFAACVGDEPADSSGNSDSGGDVTSDSSDANGDDVADGPVDAKRPAPTATGTYAWSDHWPISTVSGEGIAYDAAGDLFLAMSFYGTVTLDATHTLNSVSGSEDFAVVKIDPSGHIVWALPFGTAANEEADALTADATDVYVSGTFNGTSFDFGNGVMAMQVATATELEPFVVKLSGSDGTAQWVDNFASPSASAAYGTCTELCAGGGRIGVMCGATRDLAFKLKSGTTKTIDFINTSDDVENNAFLAELDPATGLANWATIIGGDSQTNVMGIANDSTGAMAATIYSFATAVHDTGNTVNITNRRNVGNPAMFVAKLATADGTGVWGVEFTTGAMTDTQETAPGGVAFDSANNVIVGGQVNGMSIPIGGRSISSHGGGDSFVAKLDGTSGATIWALPFGGTGDEQMASVAVDPWDEIFVTGRYASTDFAVGTTTLPGPSTSSVGIYQMKLDTNGNPFWGYGLVAQVDASGSDVYLVSTGAIACDPNTGGMTICGDIPSATSIDLGDGSFNTGGNENLFLLHRTP